MGIKNIYQTRGFWYTVYYVTIGFVLNLIIKLWKDVKSLGWFVGFLILLTAVIVYFSPTWIGILIYFLTGNAWWLGVGSAYFLWILYPTGSSLLFAAILTGLVEFALFFKKKGTKVLPNQSQNPSQI